MALRDNPYLPLYVMDFANDEKLRMCSAEATGVYIRLMCILHKSQDYGKLQIKESFVYTKPDTNRIQNKIQTEYNKEILYSEFAENLSKQMPFTVEVIKVGLLELDYYGVIRLDGNTLYQPRMVKDAAISETRRKSISKRWSEDKQTRETDNFVYTKPDTKVNTKPDTKADTNTHTNAENEYVCVYNNKHIEEKGVQGERRQTPTARFKPPKLEEVVAYAQERGNKVDPIAFFDYYEANGWVQGKQGKPLKDWKAAARYWERNGLVTSNSNNNDRQQTTSAKSGFSPICGDTPAKKTRHSSF